MTYNCFYDKTGKNVTLSFDLGWAIKVNDIVTISTFHKWKKILNLDANCAILNLLDVYFDLCFEHAVIG